MSNFEELVLAELTMVELNKGAEGVQEYFDHRVSRWDRFK